MSYFDVPEFGQFLGVLFTILLCGIIGMERELRHKDAGVRTHVLVGLGACLFTYVSLYGAPVLTGNMRWDASRIAAQIVSGIGFIGAGVIFFNRDTVRGLTTASAIWVAAAIGTACGAGMLVIAMVITFAYLVVVLLVAPALYKVGRHLGDSIIEVTYLDGKGILREVMLEFSARGIESQLLACRNKKIDDQPCAVVDIYLPTAKKRDEIMASLSELSGVTDVALKDDRRSGD